jgi:hypothetical protein
MCRSTLKDYTKKNRIFLSSMVFSMHFWNLYKFSEILNENWKSENRCTVLGRLSSPRPNIVGLVQWNNGPADPCQPALHARARRSHRGVATRAVARSARAHQRTRCGTPDGDSTGKQWWLRQARQCGRVPTGGLEGQVGARALKTRRGLHILGLDAGPCSVECSIL